MSVHPSHHKNSTFSPSPNILLNRSSLSQLDLISSKTVYPGRSDSQAALRRSSINTFSQFLFTSVDNNPYSMKLKIPKVSQSQSNPNHKNLTIKNISSTLYDDPAFSPDPLSHPFFATSHNAAWASPPAAMGRSTPSSLSLTPPALAVNIINVDRPFAPLPSMFPNKTTPRPLYDSQLSTTSVYESQPPSTPLSSTPSSADSHQPSDTAPKSVGASQSLPQKKKKNAIAMFWRKSEGIEDSAKSKHIDNKRQESPPSYDAIYSSRPVHSRGTSAPETRKLVDRPSGPPRPATTFIDARLLPTATQRNVGGHSNRAHELDRIDELDESNPLGMPVHHGGPYEAIQKIVPSTLPHNMGIQYQDLPHKPTAPRRQQDNHTNSGPLPIGVSLNLLPGQVLPRNFQENFLPWQNPIRASTTPSHPQGPPPIHLRKADKTQISKDNTPKWSNHHFSLPVSIPPPQQWRKHSAPHEQTPSNPILSDQINIGPAKTGMGTSDAPNPQYDVQSGPQPRDQCGPEGYLPRRHAHDTREDYRVTNRRSSVPRRPFDSEPNPPSSEHNRSTHATAPPQNQDRDIRSLQQTVTSSNDSSRPFDGGRVPQARHLPKRLVMPTPLQPSHLNTPQSELPMYPLDSFPQQHATQAQLLYHRPPSPPSILPPAPPSNKKIGHTQEVPISQGKKLKKRNNLNVSGIPPPPASHLALSFEPTTTPVGPPHSTPLNRNKPEKASKKVLSKRRIDL